MSRALHLTTGLRWAPKQWDVLSFRAPPHADGTPQIEIVGILGEFGGGKTFVAAARFLACCLANPADDRYAGGDDLPRSGLSAPTLGDLKKAPLVEFRKICPPELVYQERLYGEYQDITLINGHRIQLYSAKGSTNGPNLCQFWADEIQERPYIGAWDNIQARVREGRANWLNCQASGIAERGHVEELFRGINGPNRITRLLFPEDNAINMATGYVDEIRTSMPASRQRDADGWLLPEGAMYPTFSRELNVRTPPAMLGTVRAGAGLDALRPRPTSFAVDPGRSAAVAFAQPIDVIADRGRLGKRRERGLYFVDQLMPDHKDAEELAHYIREKCTWLRGRDKPAPSKWCIDGEHSVIFLDPTAEPDQVRHFAKAFPGVRIVQVQRGFYHLEANGIRAVDRAVLDLNKNVRLYVHPSLSNHTSKRGIVEMFSNHLAKKPKDKKYEHASDVVRYMIQHFVPLPEQRGGGFSKEAHRIMEKSPAWTGGLSLEAMS